MHPIHYVVYVEDTSGLRISTTVRDIQVFDNDPPIFWEDRTTQTTTTGGNLTFACVFMDNLVVQSVRLRSWSFGSGSIIIQPMVKQSSDCWALTIIAPSDNSVPIYYSFHAFDPSLNEGISPTRMVTVRDDEEPTFIEDLTPSKGTTGDPFTLRVRANDNVGVVESRVEYWFDSYPSTLNNVSMLEGAPGIWSLDIVLMPDSLAELWYRFFLRDGAGNNNTSTLRRVTIYDDDAPTFTEVPTTFPVMGLAYSISVGVEDNIGLAEIYLVYMFGHDPPEKQSVPPGGPYGVNITVPRHPTGKLSYTFFAVDIAGNVNLTLETHLIPVNLAPRTEAHIDWEVTEGEPGYLDLSGHIEDGNDDLVSLTLSCDGSGVEVIGLALIASPETIFPGRVLEVVVSDGEDNATIVISMSMVQTSTPSLMVLALPTIGSHYPMDDGVMFVVAGKDEQDKVPDITLKLEESDLGPRAVPKIDGLDIGIHPFRVDLKGRGMAVGSPEVTTVPEVPVNVPGPPRDLAAAVVDRHVVLRWQPPLNDGGAPIEGYAIQKGTSRREPAEVAEVGNIETFNDTKVVEDIEYSYQVNAINVAGHGELSKPVTVRLEVQLEPDVTTQTWLALVVTLIAVILKLFTIAITENGRFRLSLLLAPLILRRQRVLDNETRYALHIVIVERPGIHFSALREEFGMANGVTAYHLHILEREGLVTSVRDRKLKRFYSTDAIVPESIDRSPKSLRETIVDLVRERPGISQMEIMDSLELDRDGASYYLRELVKEGRLLDGRDGRYTVYRINGSIRRSGILPRSPL
jgi:predicted transcriptional regulator